MNIPVQDSKAIIFEDEGILVAASVDSVLMVHGEDLEELKTSYRAVSEAYEVLKIPKQKVYVDLTPVWKKGTPIDFLDGVEARRVTLKDYAKAAFPSTLISGKLKDVDTDPDNRVMIMLPERKAGNVWVASSVLAVDVVQANSFDELKEKWMSNNRFHDWKETGTGEWWEAPMPFEHEEAWSKGTPVEFIDGLEARIVPNMDFFKAWLKYNERCMRARKTTSKEKSK